MELSEREPPLRAPQQQASTARGQGTTPHPMAVVCSLGWLARGGGGSSSVTTCCVLVHGVRASLFRARVGCGSVSVALRGRGDGGRRRVCAAGEATCGGARCACVRGRVRGGEGRQQRAARAPGVCFERERKRDVEFLSERVEVELVERSRRAQSVTPSGRSEPSMEPSEREPVESSCESAPARVSRLAC